MMNSGGRSWSTPIHAATNQQTQRRRERREEMVVVSVSSANGSGHRVGAVDLNSKQTRFADFGAPHGSRVRSERQLEVPTRIANVPDRNRQGKLGVPISSRHSRRWIVLNRARAQHRGARARNRFPGVGLSSSAESTAQQSIDDIRNESQETAV